MTKRIYAKGVTIKDRFGTTLKNKVVWTDTDKAYIRHKGKYITVSINSKATSGRVNVNIKL